MELPPKNYFSLEEVAEKLQCTKQDLLHYAANGKLEIAAYLDFDNEKVQGAPYDGTNVHYGRSGYYYLILDDIEFFERYPGIDIKEVEFLIPSFDMYWRKTTNGGPEWICRYADDEPLVVDRNQFIIFDKDLKEFVQKHCTNANTPTTTQQRPVDNLKSIDSLVKMVITMAVTGYGYSPSETKSKVTAEIVSDADRLGLSIHPDTVRKWLKEGAGLLPTATPPAD